MSSLGVTEGGSSSPSPYLGLRPFEAQHARFFFGRSRDIDLLAANLRTARTSVVYGESGVGKSSLLRAGLGPVLVARGASAAGDEEERESLVAVVFTMSREDPTPRLSERLVTATRAAIGEADGYGEVRPALSFLETIEEATKRVDRILIVLDQFEEYLAYADGASDDRFAADFVRAIARSELPVHFMLSIREDSIASLDRFRPRSRELLANPIRIDPLTADAAHEAIRGPIEAYDKLYGTTFAVEAEFEHALIEATRPGALDLGFGGRGGLEQATRDHEPVVEAAYLQLALQTVWAAEQETGSDVMRARTFDELGGLAGIVRQHLDRIMREFNSRDQLVAAAAFRYLVTPSGMKVPYSSADLGELTRRDPAVIGSVLDRLASERNRIVRPLGVSPQGDRRYEIYHDRLADPILDWRVRRERGGERVGIVRMASATFGALALLGALVTLIEAPDSPNTIIFALTGVPYLAIAAFRPLAVSVTPVMAAYGAFFQRLAHLLVGRRRMD